MSKYTGKHRRNSATRFGLERKRTNTTESSTADENLLTGAMAS